MYDLFQNTEVAYELKKTSQIRKSIFLFRLITKRFLVKTLSNTILFFLKIGLGSITISLFDIILLY